MSPKEMSKSNTTQRTRIEDIDPFGEELSEERLRLVTGGAIKMSYPPTKVGDTWVRDEDTTSLSADTL